MRFDGSRAHRVAVKDALTDLNARGISDQMIVNSLARYLSSGKVPEYPPSTRAVGRSLIQRLRKAESDQVLAGIRSHSMGMLYNFLTVCDELPTALFNTAGRVRSAHKLAPLVEALQLNVGAKDGPLDNRKLRSLEGTFYLYRKAWTSPEQDTYVRCILQFDWVGDALFYSENQKFHDTAAKFPIDEVDRGVVLPFGMNVVLLGKGESKDLLKFFSIHDFTPYPDGVLPVHVMSGNFIAVYSKGPHPGFKVFAQRVPEGEEPTTAFYAPGELDPQIVAKIRQPVAEGPAST